MNRRRALPAFERLPIDIPNSKRYIAMLPVWLTDTVTDDLKEAARFTMLWGLEGVELRTVGEQRVPRVNEVKVRNRLAENELFLAAIEPGLFEGRADNRPRWLNELATFSESINFCKRVGCPRIVVSAFQAGSEEAQATAAEALRRAGEQVAPHNLRLAVRHGPGRAHATGTALAELLETVDHPSVGAAWDPAAALQAGEAPAEGLERLAGRIVLVRCSDGRKTGSNQWKPMPFGEGDIDWPDQLQRLRAAGYAGPLSLEIDTEPAAKHGLHAATHLIRLLRELRRTEGTASTSNR